MKKALRNITVILLIAAMCLSLCSCNVFKTMRENAERASQIQIMETPDDEEAIRMLQELVTASAGMADEMTESVSYDAGNPDIFSGGEEAGLLDASARQLRSLIMEGKPGKTEETISADDMRLLAKLDAKGALNVTVDRNYTDEKVTDEKGNYVADEDGEIVTVKKVADNVLHFTIDYYDTRVTGQNTKDDGTTEDITEYVPADEATIADVFGEPADTAAVLAAFDATADYITVNGYDVAYTNCRIVADVDLDEGIVSFVRFEKHMDVTAQATCAGRLAGYGDVTVTFPLTKNIAYSFSYPAVE